MILKILHTSDWHLGLESWTGSKSVDRLDETKKALLHLVQIAEQEKVELVLITGDVLHSRVSPKIEALNVLSDILAKFSEIAHTFLVLGNHDWQGLKAWKNLPIRNLTIVDYPEQITTEHFKIFFLPYTDPQRLLGTTEDSTALVGEYLNDFLVKVRNQIDEKKINILAGHLLIEGLIESDKEIALGVQIKKSVIPTGLDYVALGHIHNNSIVQQSPITCYAGSPITLDFGEEHDIKGAFIVEFDRHKAHIRHVSTPYKRLKTFRMPDYSESSLEILAKQLRDFDGYARVIFENLASNEVRKYLMENFECVTKVEFRTDIKEKDLSFATRQKIDVIDLYRNYVKGRFGELEESMVRLVEKLFKEVGEDQTTQS
ncbi:metallophosphoesterase family protein [Thermotoga profunda]|uniref:metallophosphoesterase family protein n=1 Tax=Thermotoga profunda TaxID=1508420 RepID=UPI0005974321|nr:DNA repair exonuclease [Thermotoga profunda]